MDKEENISILIDIFSLSHSVPPSFSGEKPESHHLQAMVCQALF